MPARLSRQILNHDPAQNDELGLHAVQNAVVREVQAVGDLDRQPGEILVSGKSVFGGFVVGFVDLVEPGSAAFAVPFT